MQMPCPHYKIKISSRAKGKNTVAQAAYQSGERLFDERSHRTKDYREKRGIVYTEILLPENAPPEYSDRNTLWNSVEAVEGQWNSQLARRFEIALPMELPIETSVELIRQHVQEQFVSKGMIADLAVHDPYPPGHNPHAHLMLTMRPMDEHGKWLPKSKKEYVLDENGKRIRLPSGNWKTQKVSTVDWNEQTNAEIWRHAWEELQNEYLQNAGRPERIDMRSYERQGIDKIPMVHQGPAVTAMEARGINTYIGNLNRDIRKTNKAIEAIKNAIKGLLSWLSEVKQAIAEIEMQPKEVYLVDLLIQKFDERKMDRFMNWDNRYGAKKADQKDFQRFMTITNYMREHKVLTVENLEEHIAGLNESAKPLKSRMKAIEKRQKEIDQLCDRLERREQLAPIHDQYLKIHWQGRKEKFKEAHKTELEEWNRCDRFIRKVMPGLQYSVKELQAERKALQSEYEDLTAQMAPLQADIDIVKDIRYLIKDLLPELVPEKKELTPERKQEKRSLLTELHKKQEIVDERDAQKAPTRQTQKKQNIEH